MWLLANTAASLSFVAALLIFIAVLLRRWHRYYRRRKRTNQPLVTMPRPKPSSRDALADASPEVLRHAVSLHELGREMSARLDSKMVALQHLIREADAQATRLEKLLAHADKGKQQHDGHAAGTGDEPADDP